MTEEQKQALIEEGNRILKHGYGTKKSDELIKIALAALTAPPVKLPKLSQSVSGERYVWSDGVGNYKQDAIIAIRAAGYEVQE